MHEKDLYSQPVTTHPILMTLDSHKYVTKKDICLNYTGHYMVKINNVKYI